MDADITFKQYLKGKLIDSEKFQAQESSLYSELEIAFNQLHPDSFTAQKLFMINPIRRKYRLKVEVENEKIATKTKLKVKIRPKIKR